MVHKKNQKQRARVEQTAIAMEVRDKEIQDMIKFGKPVEKKSNEQLYFVDKKGGSNTASSEYLTKSEKILLPNSNIDKMAVGVETEIKKPMTPVEKKYLKHVGNVKKEKSLLPSKATLRKHRSNLKASKLEIWGENEGEQEIKKNKPALTHKKSKLPTIEKENDFITTNLLENRVIKAKKVNHPAVIKKVSNIEIAEPGMSYNPSYQDHQDTLGVALAKEIIALEYIENVDNKLNPEYVEYKEMEDPEYYEAGVEKVDDPSQIISKPGERITKLEKNKRIRRAEEMKKQKAALQKKQFNKQVDQVLDTLKEVVEEEELAKSLKESRDAKKKLNTMPRRLGKYKLSESSEPILLTNELPKSLSTLTNSNYNPLKERYQNLQKRHVIEASGPQQKPWQLGYRKTYTLNSWNNTTVATLD